MRVLALLFAVLSIGAARPTYWILAEDTSNRTSPAYILGPYPSRELCRIAGALTFPTDQRFWTAKERAAEQARIKASREEAAAQEAARKAALHRAWENGGHKPGRLQWRGSSYEFDEHGEEKYTTKTFYGTSLNVTMRSCPCLEAKTGCVRVVE